MTQRTVRERDIRTNRGSIRVRETEGGTTPVVMVHGNCSSSAFFARLLADLPEELYGIALDQRGFGDTEPLPIDATRGMGDLADDLAALLEVEGISQPIVLAHSAGAGVAMQLAITRPGLLGPLILEAPMSPYGFGGTKDVDGTPCWPDHAGSGGGTANPDFTAGIAAGDRSDDNPASPRNVFRAFYVAPSYHFEDEESLLDSLLSTRVGDEHYPGPALPSDNWPNVRPGASGINNAISPAYFDVSGFADIDDRPPVTWIRGSEDLIVSDASMLDLGNLGALGAVPGWPGEDVYPAQPMVSQMRAVLDRYRGNGGSYDEVVLDGVGHSPHLEAPEQVLQAILDAVRR